MNQILYKRDSMQIHWSETNLYDCSWNIDISIVTIRISRGRVTSKGIVRFGSLILIFSRLAISERVARKTAHTVVNIEPPCRKAPIAMSPHFRFGLDVQSMCDSAVFTTLAVLVSRSLAWSCSMGTVRH